MNLSIQNNTMNTYYTLIQKTAFKGKTLTPKAFAAEAIIIKQIKTLPQNVFIEKAEFLKFCKNIDITPKISREIIKRLAEVRQNRASNNTIKRLIESSERVIEGYKWLLNNYRQLSKDEVADII